MSLQYCIYPPRNLTLGITFLLYDSVLIKLYSQKQEVWPMSCSFVSAAEIFAILKAVHLWQNGNCMEAQLLTG